jgi:dephospho-CoA kinase
LLRAIAKKKGLSNKAYADELRRIGGEEAIVKEISGYVRAALRKNNVVIVDALYKNIDLQTLKTEFPNAKVDLIFVTANRELRIKRVQGREKKGYAEAEERVAQADRDREALGYLELERNASKVLLNEGKLVTLLNNSRAAAKGFAARARVSLIRRTGGRRNARK